MVYEVLVMLVLFAPVVGAIFSKGCGWGWN